MRRRTQIAVLCCFAFGAVVTAVSIARIVSLVELFYLPSGGDPFYDIKITYSIVEPNVAISTACAPALWPLFKHYFSGPVSAKGTYGKSYGTASTGTHHHRKPSLQGGQLAITLKEYGQKGRRRDGHEELGSIASSQDRMV
ncbi:uncharacterized protein CC84DRAFT_1246221 [Paraphaeosphaeria sporulosa]|uniref:Rhodopsin domain-containing protein n=1 Tax=Paraphaeosphaeria sporulosa TaxID=1460663 RepID=A0A177CBY4_9PLEO|nr:uncharacterized protein CC84DRAFT_1246221 [Paraphaeosphaeria sporulosa]OAG04297.1 hypothetical protein CC84DRAFT_1246221 [Paraphaeosphaeria sporulosa]